MRRSNRDRPSARSLPIRCRGSCHLRIMLISISEGRPGALPPAAEVAPPGVFLPRWLMHRVASGSTAAADDLAPPPRTCCRLRSLLLRRRCLRFLLTHLLSAIAGAAAAAAVGGAYVLSQQQSPAFARNWATWGATRFPPSCNFPDLEKHNNVMADVLRNDPSVSDLRLTFA